MGQWEEIRKSGSGDEVSVIQNESFDDHSKCRIEIPRRSMNKKLTKFIRRHRGLHANMVLVHWLRMMNINMMDEICAIIKDKVFEGDARIIYGHWITRDEKESSTERRKNQSRFFKELKSISNGDGCDNIMGVAITLLKNAGGYSWTTKTETLLHLYANGTYLFDFIEERSWIETEAGTSDYSSTDVVKHCGVWDYKGDEILMQGVGYQFHDYKVNRYDSEESDFDYREDFEIDDDGFGPETHPGDEAKDSKSDYVDVEPQGDNDDENHRSD